MPSDCSELGRELALAYREGDRLRGLLDEALAREARLNEQLDRAISTVGDEVYDIGRTIDWILDGDE